MIAEPLAGSLLLAAVLASSAPPTVPERGITAEQQDGSTVVRGSAEKAGKASESGYGASEWVTVNVPACPGNELTLSQPRGEMCAEASALCAATPDPRDHMFWIYRAPAGGDQIGPNSWRRIGAACIGPQQSAGPIQSLSLEDFRRLPLPASLVNIEPPGGQTLVNIPTNVFVDSRRQIELTTSILGSPVRVHAYPVNFSWTFGDGAILNTSDPGAPYPQLRVTHTYVRPAIVLVRLVTEYSGEYSVDGGPWLSVDGVAAVASPIVRLQVVSATARLVSGSQ